MVVDPLRQDGPVAVSKTLVYQFLISYLSQACDPANLRGSLETAAEVRIELDQYLLSVSSEDAIGAIISSINCRKKLLKLSSALGISDDPSFRAAIRADEEGLATLLYSVLDTESMTVSVLSLEGARAQCFLDVAQDILDRGLLMGKEHTLQRIIRKLSERSDMLPSSLFITGATGRGETPKFGGAFGNIYQASLHDRPVALKHIRCFIRGSELHKIRSKFCREALLWKELNHPNILPFLGIDRESFSSSFPCMVSPWMENGTVLAFLEDHGRTLVDKLLHEIAQGLEYLHSRNIVHGDLRGGNILVTSDWQACLADFGLSVFSDATASNSSTRAGSIRWMAPELIHPEQFGGRFARTPASDVYAFACVSLELYTGEPPFAQFSEPVAFMKVLQGERPGRPNGPPAMSSALWDNVTSQCWEQDPAARPAARIVVQNMALLWPAERQPSIQVSIPSQSSLTMLKSAQSTPRVLEPAQSGPGPLKDFIGGQIDRPDFYSDMGEVAEGNSGNVSTIVLQPDAPLAKSEVQPLIKVPQPALAPLSGPPASSARDETHISLKRFADAPISEISKKGIEHDYGLQIYVGCSGYASSSILAKELNLTAQYAPTLDHALAGLDLLVQANTGTGEIPAFLLLAVERLSQIPYLVPRKIFILVLSPTRELVLQIGKKVQTLINIANHPFHVAHAISGTIMSDTGKRIMENPPQILIATPGRLVHLFNKTPSFVHMFSNLASVVYSKADHLLTKGFKQDLNKILAFLPSKTKAPRQALFSSASVSQEVKAMAPGALGPDYKFISTLCEHKTNTQQHAPQQSLIVPFAKHIAATFALLQQDHLLHEGTSKVMIFLPTEELVECFYEAFSHLPPGTLPPIYSVYSGRSEQAQLKATIPFKNAREAVLISSDACGMDFPRVTLIIHTGLPISTKKYIRRLRCTARAGVSGRGILILDEAEAFFLRNKTISGFGIAPVNSAPSGSGGHYLDEAQLSAASALMNPLLARISVMTKTLTYCAFLEFYNRRLKGQWTRDDLVAWGNEYVITALGWTGAALPEIRKKTVGKMGLKGVKGLNIAGVHS